MSSSPYQPQIDLISSQIEENKALLSDPELGELAKGEIERLEKEKQMLEKAASELEDAQNAERETYSAQPTNCIIEIRQGAGGDEAKIWADDLMRMYVRFTEILGLKIEYIDDMVIKVKGKTNYLSSKVEELKSSQVEQAENEEPNTQYPTLNTPYSIFKYESGVHRVQRVPETESQGRIHTSTASVAVLPEVAQNAVEIRDEDLEWSFMRAGGAGGQSVNKTSSAVRLVHTPSGIVVNARQERKQAQNRQIALELLRSQLWEIEEERKLKEIGDARSVIGRAQRAEKIRTYNYPQNRVTDHRIHESWHNLENILDGGLEDVVVTLAGNL